MWVDLRGGGRGIVAHFYCVPMRGGFRRCPLSLLRRVCGVYCCRLRVMYTTMGWLAAVVIVRYEELFYTKKKKTRALVF